MILQQFYSQVEVKAHQKGVELSHSNIAANAKQAAIELGAVDSDVIMSTLPTFHAFGFAITTLCLFLKASQLFVMQIQKMFQQ